MREKGKKTHITSESNIGKWFIRGQFDKTHREVHCSRARRRQEPELLFSNALFVSMDSRRKQQLASVCWEGEPLVGHSSVRSGEN